ncbi:hypothetical protein WJX72_010412 [[Myrmecia] bisecta]|uniref:Exoribonuclease phosphorolytic domain-containing protein n=1 Tax=[Myrmecia] bisecta TaxID=41462 RepID=A0AAW1QSL2_9CHLO
MQPTAGPGPSSEALAKRSDRTELQLRVLTCERSLLHRADGSAKWSQGQTSVLAAIYGPRLTFAKKEHPETCVVEVLVRPKTRLPGPTERQTESLIRQCVEGVVLTAMHPRTAILVVIQVVQNDGCVMACALNAVAAALVDAGIPMHQNFVSVTSALMPGASVVIDPDLAEEQAAEALVCSACTTCRSWPEASAAQKGPAVLAVYTRGAMPVEDYLTLVELNRQGCERVAQFSVMAAEKSLVGKSR